MAKFKDCLGREWVVRLTAGDLRRVREQTGIELGRLLVDAHQLSAVLFGDPEKIGQVLWVLIESQARERKIDELAFADGFDRDAVEAASIAVADAVADFTQPRTVASRMKAAIRGTTTKAEAAMGAKLDELLAKADATTSSGSAGSLPGSPASTPKGAPSAS